MPSLFGHLAEAVWSTLEPERVRMTCFKNQLEGPGLRRCLLRAPFKRCPTIGRVMAAFYSIEASVQKLGAICGSFRFSVTGSHILFCKRVSRNVKDSSRRMDDGSRIPQTNPDNLRSTCNAFQRWVASARSRAAAECSLDGGATARSCSM